MIYQPYTQTDRVDGMAWLMRYIFLYFGGSPAGGQVLGQLLCEGRE